MARALIRRAHRRIDPHDRARLIAGCLAALLLVPASPGVCAGPEDAEIRVETLRRLMDRPILSPGMPGLDNEIGQNINGPSLIRVPAWVPRPLGRYYLYFANHEGPFIEMAYANTLTGPWHVRKGGVLPLVHTPAIGHVASPDVIVDDARHRILLYFHGPTEDPRGKGQYYRQATFRASSDDGLEFTAEPAPVADAYLRTFRWHGQLYGLAMSMKESAYPALLSSGRFFRWNETLHRFDPGPRILDGMRHCAVMVRGNRLEIFYTRIGDAPERILRSIVDLRPGWKEWTAQDPVEIARPTLPFEGADKPLVSSHSGKAGDYENALRDPAIFEEDGKRYLLYSVAGEKGIAIGELTSPPGHP